MSRTISMSPFVLLFTILLCYPELCPASLLHPKNPISWPSVGSVLEQGDFRFTFEPPQIDKLYEKEEQKVNYNVTTCCNSTSNVTLNVTLSIAPEDDVIATVSQNATSELLFYEATGDGTLVAFGSFAVKGKRLGDTILDFRESLDLKEGKHNRSVLFQDGAKIRGLFIDFQFGKRCNNDPVTMVLGIVWRITERNADPTEPGSTAVGPPYKVIVLRRRTVADDVFRYGIIVLACILYIGFGCTIDLKVVWEILKRPISPAIGFCCQFILMPLLGFGISRMFSLSDELSFGLLAMASSPGGGSSNVWVSLLGGHLDLSLTMTTISTFGSLGMMPLWMFLLGQMFVDPTRMSIPYMSLFRSLLTIIIPCAVGLVIKRFLPKVATPISRFTRPFSGIFVIYILTFGTYVNLYMYVIMGTQPKVIGAAILLPAFGYGIAFALSLLLRREKRDGVAISIETGVQNASIPIIMLQGNFQQPEGDIAAVMPVATSLFTQFPIMFAWLGLVIYRRCKPEADVTPSDVEMDEVKQQPTGELVKTPQVVVDDVSGVVGKGEIGEEDVAQGNGPGTDTSLRF